MLKPRPLPEYEKVKFNKVGWLYYNAIIELLDEYEVDEISVQMILERTETSRSTFYKYFSDKYALMHYVHYHDVMTSNMYFSAENLTKAFSQKINFYKKLYRYEGQNSFREFYRTFWVNSFRQNFMEKNNNEEYTAIINSVFLFYADGLFSLTRDWVLSDCTNISDKDILTISRYFFPDHPKNKIIIDFNDMIHA